MRVFVDFEATGSWRWAIFRLDIHAFTGYFRRLFFQCWCCHCQTEYAACRGFRENNLWITTLVCCMVCRVPSFSEALEGASLDQGLGKAEQQGCQRGS